MLTITSCVFSCSAKNPSENPQNESPCWEIALKIVCLIGSGGALAVFGCGIVGLFSPGGFLGQAGCITAVVVGGMDAVIAFAVYDVAKITPKPKHIDTKENKEGLKELLELSIDKKSPEYQRMCSEIDGLQDKEIEDFKKLSDEFGGDYVHFEKQIVEDWQPSQRFDIDRHGWKLKTVNKYLPTM